MKLGLKITAWHTVPYLSTHPKRVIAGDCHTWPPSVIMDKLLKCTWVHHLSQNSEEKILETQNLLGALIEDKDKSCTDAAEGVGDEAFVDASGNTLFCGDLLQAIECAIVDMLLWRQLGLHLQTTANGVKWVTDCGAGDDCSLRRDEGGHDTQDALVILVWVQADKGIEGSQLEATVRNDTGQRDTEACVEATESLRACSCLLEAIKQAVESLLARSDIGCKSRSCIIQWVDDAQTSCGSHATRGHVNREEHTKVCLGAVLWEHLLDGVLERQIEGLRGKYLMQLVKLPRQKAATPCSLLMREKQSPMPLYLATSPLRINGFASCVWISSLTRSMGAVKVFDTAPATPPKQKSVAQAVNETSSFPIVA